MRDQIEQMLKDAWEKFCDYYDKNAPQYRENWRPNLSEEQAKDSHWICWNEYDLMFHIGRFFYDFLSDKKEKEFSNIEVHFEKNVSPDSFENYKFANRLGKLKKKLKKWPKVDMIIAYEDRKDPFLLCAEVKYFHSSQHQNPIKLINDDIEKLKALKDCKIAKRVVFTLFDDYYWYKRGKKTITKIQQKVKEIRKDGITVLDHTSKAKI